MRTQGHPRPQSLSSNMFHVSFECVLLDRPKLRDGNLKFRGPLDVEAWPPSKLSKRSMNDFERLFLVQIPVAVELRLHQAFYFFALACDCAQWLAFVWKFPFVRLCCVSPSRCNLAKNYVHSKLLWREHLSLFQL